LLGWWICKSIQSHNNFGKTKAYAVYMPSVRTDMKAATASLD